MDNCGEGLRALEMGLCATRTKPEQHSSAQDLNILLQHEPKTEQDILRLELAKSQEESRTTLTIVTKSLSDLGNKLDEVESSWSPWAPVNDAKQQLEEMQKIVDLQITVAAEKQDHMMSKQDSFGASTPKQVRYLAQQVERTQSGRRLSLTDVQQSLSEIKSKLDHAETSWAPWEQVNDAKQQLADVQNIYEQQADNLGDTLAGA